MANRGRPAGEDSRYWVSSVARAAEVLETLATAQPGHGMSVTEVAAACRLSKSAAFSTLYTLRQVGLVADEGDGMSRRYRLGMGLARLGWRAQSQVSLRDVARPVLTGLTQATGLSSRLAVGESDHAVVVDQVTNGQRIQFDLRMGVRELPHCTGLGKALLAEMTDAQVTELIARVGMPRRTGKTIVELDRLLAHLADVRQLGYAVDDEEDAEGIFCIGGAVHDHEGRCVGAVSVTGMKLDIPAWRLQEFGHAVRDAARRISADLGHRDDAG